MKQEKGQTSKGNVDIPAMLASLRGLILCRLTHKIYYSKKDKNIIQDGGNLTLKKTRKRARKRKSKDNEK